MRRIISPAIAAIVVAAGLLLAILSGYIPNMFPDFVRNHPVRFWGSVIGLFALLVGYAFAEARHQAQASKTEPAIEPEQAQRNRQAMLEKVRATWIAGVLDRSVAEDARIALGLEARPDAVIDPVDLVVQRPGRTAQQLPGGIAIHDIYNQLGGALLILGAPGAGKTTLLLELTRDLLDRATDNPQHPIPVVFPLSTWAAQRQPLAAWLVDELVLRYQVSRKLAQAWIDADAILPLLDGLDEVVDPHRNACVEAINAYRQTRGHLPLVVSSRIADYQALTTRLQLHGAIVAQPLSRDQVRTYLRTVGVAAIPSSTSPFWELLDTPLMLTVAALAYAGQPLDALPADPVAARNQLFAAYIDRMFQRNSPQRPFTDVQTHHYLAYLAYQMQQHNQTVFYLERMQPTWLQQRHQPLYAEGVGLVVGLSVGLSMGVLGWLLRGLQFGLMLGMGNGIIFRKTYELASRSNDITIIESYSWSWIKFRSIVFANLGHHLKIGMVSGIISGLVLLGILTLFNAQINNWFGLVLGGMSAIIASLVFGLFESGVSVAELDEHTTANQGILRSGQNALFGAVIGSLAGGLISSVTLVPFKGPAVGLGVALVSALGLGLFTGGGAYIQHYVLRLLLIRNGFLPRRLVPFLEYATQRIFLRRVGGGYIFIHRLLLEHFAVQYTPPGAAPQPAAPDNEP